MFCYHCQEAKKNKVCDTAGICGKKADVASLQDLLMFCLKGLAFYGTRADEFGLVGEKNYRFMAKAMFSMVTNVNFDPVDFVQLIDEAVRRRNSIRKKFLAAYRLKHGAEFTATLPEEAVWQYETIDDKAFIDKGETVGVEKDLEQLDADVHALQECLLYGTKGLGSLAVHGVDVGVENEELYRFLYQALDFTLAKDNLLEKVLEMTLRCGELGLTAMGRLTEANAKRFGDPVPTKVFLDTWERPGILVSGHDLQDIEDLLEQTDGSGVDVYTHGEAISAHTYPALKKYFNLVANYGNAWQEQKSEFPKFNGPILVTSNSIQQPKKTYEDKLFSTGMVAWPGVTHIAERKPGQRKDFSGLIELAKQCEPPKPLSEGTFTTGYGLKALDALTDKITAAIKADEIHRIIVLVGCDGRHKERRYYTQLAESLPENALIITAGDTKYRFHQMDFGMIGEIPRLLDVGQGHDFQTIIVFLQRLQQKLELNELNQLPVSFNIAWYEQQTLLMLLALFALNFSDLRVGPTLPPFFTPNLLDLLSERYSLKGIDTPENDATAMMNGE